MAGYPCCCRKRPQCGECHGTAPAQYQLTVPTGTFGNNATAYPQGCGEACDQYNGVFLLDYDAELTPFTGPDSRCIWESPDFELCSYCNFEPDLVTITCAELTWHWRVELSDEFEGDGDVRAFVFLISSSPTYVYMWSGEFAGNCSAPIEVHWEPVFLQAPAPGCTPNTEVALLLEVPS